MFNPWKLFKDQPGWVQRPKKRRGWVDNKAPTSRRFLNDNVWKYGDWIGEGRSEAEGLTLDPTYDKNEQEVNVPSTAVASYRYNPETRDLFIVFTSGDKEYCYPDVPREVVKEFGEAVSKGRFVHDVIAGYSVANGKQHG